MRHQAAEAAFGGSPAHSSLEPRLEHFTSGGVAIAVEWFEAEAPAGARSPAVLVLYGADGLARGDRYRTAAGLLAGAGYHVAMIRYFDRTGSERASFMSLAHDYPLWLEAAADAVSFVAGRPEVDDSRLGLVGISLGAALALALASRDERIKAVVDYFGPLVGPAEQASRLPPVLILHGALDPVVPALNAFRLESLLKQLGSPYEIMIYPDQGHGFHGSAQLDAASRVAAFLERHLRGAR